MASGSLTRPGPTRLVGEPGLPCMLGPEALARLNVRLIACARFRAMALPDAVDHFACDWERHLQGSKITSACLPEVISCRP